MVERIRELLDARQLSPTQFADTIGVGRPVVSHILSGRNKPSLEVVQKITAAFPELALPWLLNGDGPMLANATSAPATTAVRETKPSEAQNPPVAARTRRAAASAARKASATLQAPAKTPVADPAPTAAAPPLPEGSDAAIIAASPAATAAPAPLAAGASIAAAGALPNPGKAIRRIVIFYHDGTFVDYQPEN